MMYPCLWEPDNVHHMLGSCSRVLAAYFEDCVNGNAAYSVHTLCRHFICTVKHLVRSLLHTKR